MLKCSNGLDNTMDIETKIDETKIEHLKNKIIDVCAPYELFKNFYYDKDENKLKNLDNVNNKKKQTARSRQREAFFNIHNKNNTFKNIEELLDLLVISHLSVYGCEWCSTKENLIIDHHHEISSIYGNSHLGKYRGCLCKSCNAIEATLKKLDINEKKKYLENKMFGPETIKFILRNWYD
jgi:hypothetical protein